LVGLESGLGVRVERHVYPQIVVLVSKHKTKRVGLHVASTKWTSAHDCNLFSP